MNRGKFKHLIVVQRPDHARETVDEYGRRITPWVEHATRCAQVADVSGRDFYEAAAHQLQDVVTFTMPWVPESWSGPKGRPGRGCALGRGEARTRRRRRRSRRQKGEREAAASRFGA